MAKISCSTWGYSSSSHADWKLEEITRSVRNVGYGGIEIVTMPWLFTADMPDEKTENVNRLLRSRNLQLACLSPVFDFLKPQTGSLEDEISRLEKYVDLAVRMECRTIRVTGTMRPPRGMSTEEAVDIEVKALKRCAEYAEDKNVKLALENHGTFDAIPENMIEIVNRTNSDFLGVCLHPRPKGHKQDTLRIVDTIGEKVFHTHLMEWKLPPTDYRELIELRREGRTVEELISKFGKSFVDEALAWRSEVVPTGEGDVDFKTHLERLSDKGYNGWYNFEGTGGGAGIPEYFAKRAFDYIKDLLLELGIR